MSQQGPKQAVIAIVFGFMIYCGHKLTYALKSPTAEKLMQHLFFKQAKKKDYLAKTLLASLPALEHRPHKKIPQKHPSITRTTTWDFDADELEDDQVKQSEQSEQINEDKGVESDQETRNSEVDKTTDVEDKNAKKHISFGDVVVRNPPQPHMSPNAAAYSPPLGSEPKSNADTAVTAPKKSRFIIQETITPREPFDPLGTPPIANSPILSTPPELASHDESNALLLGLGMTSSMTPPPSDGSMRKGRFSVNSTPRQSFSGESNFAPPAEVYQLNKDTALSRINSQENIGKIC